MKLKTLDVKGVGGIQDLSLDFNYNMNLICGPNGVGKTTILECIGHAFHNTGSSILRRNVGVENGSFSVTLKHDNGEASRTFNTNSFHPHDRSSTFVGFYKLAGKVIVFKTHRSFPYRSLGSIEKDKTKDVNTLSREASTGVNSVDIKSWFVQRFLWSAHPNILSEAQVANLELAKKCFGLLSDKIHFSRVQADTLDILVENGSGEIYYEFLSSGYKSCLVILLGLIKEIELRFKEPHLKAEKFDGVVLLDELDLHLHPEWQANLVKTLKEVFPNTQFIATTHSPHMIQVANPNEIIPLEFVDEKVAKRQVPSEKFGYKGWSIEEILIDVMGMKSTKSDFRERLIKKFFAEVDAKNEEEAKKVFEELDQILHPANELRQLLKLHLADLGVEA